MLGTPSCRRGDQIRRRSRWVSLFLDGNFVAESPWGPNLTPQAPAQRSWQLFTTPDYSPPVKLFPFWTFNSMSLVISIETLSSSPSFCNRIQYVKDDLALCVVCLVIFLVPRLFALPDLVRTLHN